MSYNNIMSAGESEKATKAGILIITFFAIFIGYTLYKGMKNDTTIVPEPIYQVQPPEDHILTPCPALSDCKG